VAGVVAEERRSGVRKAVGERELAVVVGMAVWRDWHKRRRVAQARETWRRVEGEELRVFVTI
jgi:hypothetical protein